jgi:hypothetical protein
MGYDRAWGNLLPMFGSSVVACWFIRATLWAETKKGS